ncbi:unnamed protein product [Sphagnum jensenii]|uniref:Uncharacterized protein n=1 Tax=Sphagnum jensenii TaxID=128206 RepID=A0ABP1BND1_9BRYO
MPTFHDLEIVRPHIPTSKEWHRIQDVGSKPTGQEQGIGAIFEVGGVAQNPKLQHLYGTLSPLLLQLFLVIYMVVLRFYRQDHEICTRISLLASILNQFTISIDS